MTPAVFTLSYKKIPSHQDLRQQDNIKDKISPLFLRIVSKNRMNISRWQAGRLRSRQHGALKK